MRRSLLLLCLVLPAVADNRAEYVAARDALLKADYQTLPPEKRDELFQKLGLHDQPEAVKGIMEVGAAYGTYLAGVEAKLQALQEKLRGVMDRQGLTDLEIGFRSTWLREQGQLDAVYLRAGQSLDLLAGTVGGFRDPRTVQAALSQIPKQPTWRVRYLLPAACGVWHRTLKDERTSKQLLQTLQNLSKDEEARIRVAVVRALRDFRREEAFALQVLYLKDPDWRVRAAAVECVQEHPTPEVVSALIEAMKQETGRLRDDINAALGKITGENQGFAETWEQWWNSVGRQIPEKRGEGDKPEKPRYVDEQGPNFYGIPTRSNRICFIIDVSGSMIHPVDPLKNRPVITGRKEEKEMPAQGKTRIEVAQNELKRAISKLNPKQNFTIIFYSHKVQPWRTDMVKATTEAKNAAYEEIDRQMAAGATYTLGALREAFTIAGAFKSGGGTARETAGVDTIFLLSDGAPTDAEMREEAKLMDPQIILAAVREWNKDLQITIHCIAVDVLDNAFLRTLAAENHGQFVERKG